MLRAETGEPADVAGAGGVIDDSDHHEQSGLEHGVRAQHRQPGEHQVAAARPDHQRDESELADGAERQDELEVVLADGSPPGEQHGQQPQRDDHGSPRWRVGESGGHAGHQVDAGLDHGRGVQVGADGSWGGHRTRQPEVHRDDRRLGQRTDEYEHHPHRRGDPRRGRRDQFGQQVRPGELPEEDDSDEHGQPARGGHQQGLGGRAPAGRPFGIVAHQQERQHRRELPEQVEHQHVVTDDQPEHGARECDEFGREAGQPFLGVPVAVVEVLGAVEQHQCTYREHQHAHDRGQRVEPQVDVHRELGHPVDAHGVRRSGGSRPVRRHPTQ